MQEDTVVLTAAEYKIFQKIVAIRDNARENNWQNLQKDIEDYNRWIKSMETTGLGSYYYDLPTRSDELRAAEEKALEVHATLENKYALGLKMLTEVEKHRCDTESTLVPNEAKIGQRLSVLNDLFRLLTAMKQGDHIKKKQLATAARKEELDRLADKFVKDLKQRIRRIGALAADFPEHVIVEVIDEDAKNKWAPDSVAERTPDTEDTNHRFGYLHAMSEGYPVHISFLDKFVYKEHLEELDAIVDSITSTRDDRTLPGDRAFCVCSDDNDDGYRTFSLAAIRELEKRHSLPEWNIYGN